MTAVRVLIADEHEIVRRGAGAILEGQGGYCVVAETADSDATIAAAAEHLPDVAIIDVPRSTAGTPELIRHIRQVSPATEILVFTAEESETLLVEAFRAGARGFLLKSATEQVFLQAVATVLRHQTWLSDSSSKWLADDLAERHLPGSPGNLTARERQVLSLIATGMANKAIARHLEISLKTVEAHRTALIRKLGTSSAARMVRYAIRNGLISA